jgi:ATP-dependent RNA helicase DeaD
MTFPTTHPALARALSARDYAVPTSVQLAVLEANNAGRDLLVSAQTGSGKTVAFGLAMASTLLGSAENFERAAEPLALIIAPTRELAMQVQRELAWLYAETSARVIACVGGMDARAEARLLNAGAHIVVGTPGRLRDHIERKRLDLAKLKTIVLDEADEMLDLGFREDLEYILDVTPAGRQTLLFSATMPREIETLARRYQRDAVRIETLRRDEQHADIEYRAIRVAPNDIENAVVNVLRFHEARATLVFCSTREAVKRMHARLFERGFSAVALSGELTQHERSQALQALRDGRARVLVATDVAARGLDLPDLALVIHADLPNDRETLLHRSGRTGRAGKKGLCTLIVPYNRRRKAETLLGAAKVKVTWGAAPTADEIRARDQERFLADAIFTEAPIDDDVALARTLQTARTADEIALALVRIHRARLPAPEDLPEDTGPPTRRDDRPREKAPWKSERDERGPRPPRAPREDGREMVWFRLNIGRERNADPRWLLPLICRAGNVTKGDIGAIKIFDRDTRFQIVADLADQFALSAKSNPQKDGHISRVGPHSDADNLAVSEAIKNIPAPEARQKLSFKPNDATKHKSGKPSWRERDKSKSNGARTMDKPSATTSSEHPKTKAKFAHKKKHRAGPVTAR